MASDTARRLTLAALIVAATALLAAAGAFGTGPTRATANPANISTQVDSANTYPVDVATLTFPTPPDAADSLYLSEHVPGLVMSNDRLHGVAPNTQTSRDGAAHVGATYHEPAHPTRLDNHPGAAWAAVTGAAGLAAAAVAGAFGTTRRRVLSGIGAATAGTATWIVFAHNGTTATATAVAAAGTATAAVAFTAARNRRQTLTAVTILAAAALAAHIWKLPTAAAALATVACAGVAAWTALGQAQTGNPPKRATKTVNTTRSGNPQIRAGKTAPRTRPAPTIINDGPTLRGVAATVAWLAAAAAIAVATPALIGAAALWPADTAAPTTTAPAGLAAGATTPILGATAVANTGALESYMATFDGMSGATRLGAAGDSGIVAGVSNYGGNSAAARTQIVNMRAGAGDEAGIGGYTGRTVDIADAASLAFTFTAATVALLAVCAAAMRLNNGPHVARLTAAGAAVTFTAAAAAAALATTTPAPADMAAATLTAAGLWLAGSRTATATVAAAAGAAAVAATGAGYIPAAAIAAALAVAACAPVAKRQLARRRTRTETA